MREIDEMDMLGFLRIRAWSAMQEQKKKEPKHAYIDEVWPDLKQNTLQFCAWIKMSCYKILNQKQAIEFIKMLNDSILRSELTDAEYDSTVKTELPPIQ